MSKRKRAPKPPADDSTDDSSVKDDMVHVTPDLLAGGSDVFAGHKTQPAAEETVAAETPAPEEPSAPDTSVDSEPQSPLPESPDAAAQPSPSGAAPPAGSAGHLPTEWGGATSPPSGKEASTTLTPEPPAAAPPPPPPSPPYVQATPYRARPRRAGSAAALGVVLVVLGIFALVVALTGYDLTQNGWPLFILIPGLTLLVAGFVSFGSVATIPGGIVTMLGVVLAYTSSTEHWTVLAYAWALVVPFGIGLGMYLQALRDRDHQALRTGRTLLAVGFMIFLIGFVLFESILGISGRDTFGLVGKGALPALLIIVGVILFARSWQRSRQV